MIVITLLYLSIIYRLYKDEASIVLAYVYLFMGN